MHFSNHELKNKILICVNPSERDDCLKYFNDDIGYYLALLKVVSTKSKRCDFASVISQLIVHTKVFAKHYLYKILCILH